VSPPPTTPAPGDAAPSPSPPEPKIARVDGGARCGDGTVCAPRPDVDAPPAPPAPAPGTFDDGGAWDEDDGGTW